MKSENKSGWLGQFDILITYKDGTQYKEIIKNRITNQAINAFRDILNGETTDLEIKYLALGSSDKSIDDDDTTLDNEQFRVEFVSTVKPQTGQLQKTAIVLDDEAVFHIKEIGIFAGDATETTDSGFMISRVLWDRDKTELESIQFVRTDTIQRG